MINRTYSYGGGLDNSLERVVAYCFYGVLSFNIFALVFYQSSKVPKSLIYLLALTFSFLLKDFLYKFILKRVFNVYVNRTFLESVEPISFILVLVEVFFKGALVHSSYCPAVLWQKPIKVNKWGFNEREIAVISFLNTLIHLFLILLSIALLLFLKKFYLIDFKGLLGSIGPDVGIPTRMLGQFVFFMLSINTIGFLMNLIPFHPFDFGCYLEARSSNLSLLFLAGKMGSFLVFLYYYWGFNYFSPIINPFILFFRKLMEV